MRVYSLNGDGVDSSVYPRNDSGWLEGDRGCVSYVIAQLDWAIYRVLRAVGVVDSPLSRGMTVEGKPKDDSVGMTLCVEEIIG